MECKNCKRKIKDNSLFCPYCGKIPTIDPGSGENVGITEKSFTKDKLNKALFFILPLLAVGLFCLWFVRTVTIDVGTTSALIQLDVSLFAPTRKFDFLVVTLVALSFLLRIVFIAKKDNRTPGLLILSAVPDIFSLGIIVFRLISLNSSIMDMPQLSANSAGYSLNFFGWLFIAVCIISTAIHLLSIYFSRKAAEDK